MHRLKQSIKHMGSLGDRKSTRLNSSHSQISYAVFCLKKKKKKVDACVITKLMKTATDPGTWLNALLNTRSPLVTIAGRPWLFQVTTVLLTARTHSCR